jgi:hypothetical protein
VAFASRARLAPDGASAWSRLHCCPTPTIIVASGSPAVADAVEFWLVQVESDVTENAQVDKLKAQLIWGSSTKLQILIHLHTFWAAAKFGVG